MITIGIDPGTIRTGYGIVRKAGTRFSLLHSGTIRTKEKDSMEQRLLHIHEELDKLLTTYGPEQAAVEDVFFSKNARSALKLGQVRGVILLTMTRRDLPVSSYSPAFIKRQVVGTGRAGKNQVQRVVQTILSMSHKPQEDEGDALAVAICHLNAFKPRPQDHRP